MVSRRFLAAVRFIQRRLPRFSHYTGDKLRQPNCTIGAFTYGNPRVHWWGEPVRLQIGKFCSIGENVEIYLGGNHRVDWITTYPFSQTAQKPLEWPDSAWPEAARIKGHPATKGDVVIGNDVWVGTGARIFSGVRIGDGAVVGAHSIVAKDIPPYAIAVGNPAKVVKFRFPEATIEKLLQVQWWDWPIEKIRENVSLLCSENVEALFQE